MSLSGVNSASLNMSQTQAQWDAITAAKETSPFAPGNADRNSTAAAALDAMLPGYGTMSSLNAGGQGEETLAQVTERVRAAQQSTIDLFA
ncbi:MAG: hypothetical protein J7513_11660 [Solirubrobacteraceae bacterium]|nr:hypothetical protein [Solirubrobacteraceae bacterium]